MILIVAVALILRVRLDPGLLDELLNGFNHDLVLQEGFPLLLGLFCVHVWVSVVVVAFVGKSVSFRVEDHLQGFRLDLVFVFFWGDSG